MHFGGTICLRLSSGKLNRDMAAEIFKEGQHAEQREAPIRQVSVYRVVEKRFLQQVLEHGIPAPVFGENGHRPPIEEMLSEANTAHPDFDRMSCLFFLRINRITSVRDAR